MSWFSDLCRLPADLLRYHGMLPFPAPEADPPPPPADRTQLGAHAERLLADPVLALAFDLIEHDLVAVILASEVGAAAEREAAYRLHWATEQLRSKLRAMLGNAKVLKAEADRREREDARQAELRTRYA